MRRPAPDPPERVVAGRRPVLESLRAGTGIERVLLVEGAQGRVIDEIRSLAAERQVPVETLDRRRFAHLAANGAPQGVLAVVAPRRFSPLEDLIAVRHRRAERGFLLLLDEITDPQNLGALVRTAECAGAHGVVLPRHHAAPVSPTVVKASAGATEHMPIAEVTNLVAAIRQMKDEGFWVVGLDAAGAVQYDRADYTRDTAIVVGSEGRGIRRLVREHCDHLVRIPLFGRIASLNASVAGALVMYEVARQRRPPARA